jgi:hypothetical protein
VLNFTSENQKIEHVRTHLRLSWRVTLNGAAETLWENEEFREMYRKCFPKKTEE